MALYSRPISALNPLITDYSAISAYKIADFQVHLFRVGLVWHANGIYHSAISAFLEPDHHHKASSYSIISKLMCHFNF